MEGGRKTMSKLNPGIMEQAGVNKNNAKFFIKNFTKFQKIYKNLCRSCKQKCLRKPRRPMTDYCDKCQKMMEDILK